MSDTRSHDWEKKSERFEVRLSHTKKLAFQEACERQGDTPSEAVRRSIESYLGRSEMDALRHGPGRMASVYPVALSALSFAFVPLIIARICSHSASPSEWSTG